MSGVFSMISSCVVLLGSPDGRVPFGRMTVSALSLLIEACVHEGLVSASHVHFQFSFTSIPVAGLSVEVALPGGGKSCLP